jgi:hypothetical protein
VGGDHKGVAGAASSVSEVDELDGYVWDELSASLDAIAGTIFGTRVRMTPERLIAAFYVSRAKRRTAALSLLFEGGHYLDAVALVRTAYEDWIACAWRLAPANRDSSFDSVEGLGPSYARLYKRFEALCGRQAVRREFNPVPDYAKAFVRRKPDPSYTRRDWRGWADDLSLGTVHDFAYNYLSELAHGSLHSVGEHLEVAGDRYSEKSVSRDAERERLLAFWAFWFHLRVLTVAGHEWGIDLEKNTDDLLAEMRRQRVLKTMVGCVMRRERQARPRACGGGVPTDC